jgi:hypothetical protein
MDVLEDPVTFRREPRDLRAGACFARTWSLEALVSPGGLLRRAYFPIDDSFPATAIPINHSRTEARIS